MNKLNYSELIRFWQKNDEAKRGLVPSYDPEGLSYGLYDDFPLWLNRYYAFFQNLAVDRFLKDINIAEDAHVLEIGCGAGRWCRKLFKKPHLTITGLDVVFHILRNNSRYYSDPINYLSALASALPVRSGIMDLVYSVAVIHHLPPDIQDQTLADIHRVLKTGKHFFMIESTEFESPSNHLFARRFDDWKTLLENHDFQIIDAVGQEYIDWRKIIRPIRRRIKFLVEPIFRQKMYDRATPLGQQEGAVEHNIAPHRLSLSQKVFYLLFFPLVCIAYPLEWILFRTGKRNRANYACLLARKI